MIRLVDKLPTLPALENHGIGDPRALVKSMIDQGLMSRAEPLDEAQTNRLFEDKKHGRMSRGSK
jgi:hypothetical protein